jgi:hypothetical protein
MEKVKVPQISLRGQPEDRFRGRLQTPSSLPLLDEDNQGDQRKASSGRWNIILQKPVQKLKRGLAFTNQQGEVPSV